MSPGGPGCSWGIQAAAFALRSDLSVRGGAKVFDRFRSIRVVPGRHDRFRERTENEGNVEATLDEPRLVGGLQGFDYSYKSRP
jgi:hypothetical protein